MYSCVRCDLEFIRSKGEVNRGRTKFCSRECSDEHKKERAVAHAEKVLKDGKKQCKACDKTLDLKMFPRSKTSRTGYFSYCIDCRKLINRKADEKRWSTQREKLILQRRNANYRKNFGITVHQYDLLLNSQKGVCAICFRNEDKKMLHVDHDHSSGIVRGILCENCNRGIGMFKDDIKLLASAINYLKKVSNE